MARNEFPNKRATLLDVSRAAGVSKATVSNVINNKPGASPKLRKRIQQLVKTMEFVPRPSARHLSLNRSDTVAVLFQDLTAGWLLGIYRGILAQASESKYNVVTALSTREGDEYELPTSVLGTASVDGLLWLDPRVEEQLVLKFRKAYPSIPFVLIQSRVRLPGLITVSIENEKGARLAMRHLLEQGRRQVMLITGQEANRDSQERLRGAQQALQEFNLHADPRYILNGHNNHAATLEALKAFHRDGHPLPDAVFGFNDTMALAALRWFRDQRIRVPEDVAIAGFDGTDEAQVAGLTTIETPIRNLGVMAARLLVEQIKNSGASPSSNNVVLEGTLRLGTTTTGNGSLKHTEPVKAYNKGAST
ncbi:MAG: LacI family DNA-binding transcriptional regulator [Lentisphaerota bacterium]